MLLRRRRSVDVDLRGPRSAAAGHQELESRTRKAFFGGHQRRPSGLSRDRRRHNKLGIFSRSRSTVGASEGCGSAPELQRHGRRRGSSPQGVNRRPVPPSQPVALLSQAPRSTTRDDPSRARKSFSMPNKPAATTEGQVSFRPICGSLSEVQPRTPSSHLSYPVNSIIERQQPRSPGLHQLLLDGLQPC